MPQLNYPEQEWKLYEREKEMEFSAICVIGSMLACSIILIICIVI